MSATLDLNKIDEILMKYGNEDGALIPVLQSAQEAYGYSPEEILRRISRGLKVPISKIYGIVTFYAQFYLSPRGRHVIKSCQGTACHVRGAKLLPNQVSGQLGISPGCTTADGEFTLNNVNSLGACALGPVVVMNETYHHHTTPKKLRTLIEATYENKTGDTSHARASGASAI